VKTNTKVSAGDQGLRDKVGKGFLNLSCRFRLGLGFRTRIKGCGSVDSHPNPKI
jgi:hypothetical protein